MTQLPQSAQQTGESPNLESIKPSLAQALITLGSAAQTIAAAYEAETQAWKYASLATQQRMSAMHEARCAAAILLESHVDPAIVFKIIDKQSLLPVVESLHFAKAWKEGRLDLARFQKYLRSPSNISSTPSDVMARRIAQAEATAPSTMTEPQPETSLPVRFRAQIPDQTTKPTPAYL